MTKTCLAHLDAMKLSQLPKTSVTQACAYFLTTSLPFGPKFNLRLSQSERMEEISSKWCAADVKHRSMRGGSTAVRDQGIFIRGYKICDRHTGLARIFHRNCMKDAKDGFTPIAPRDEEDVNTGDDNTGDDSTGSGDDEDTERDPSDSHQDPLSEPPNNPSPSSSEGKDGESSSTTRTSDGGSGPSDSANNDPSESIIGIDEDLALYLQLSCDKVYMLPPFDNNLIFTSHISQTPTALEIMLEYIIEVLFL